MARWLVKSEPESYSWDDLIRDSRTEWDGVRNNAARLHLRAIKKGDEAFFYRSLVEPAVVGIVRVSRGPGPDPKDPNWVSVQVEPVRALKRPVTLKEIKADPFFSDFALVRISRLSVMPVSEPQWKRIEKLASA